MSHPSLVKVSPLELWSQPMLRLTGMRTLCRSDYVLVTPIERDRLVSEGYAEDYAVAPDDPTPATPIAQPADVNLVDNLAELSVEVVTAEVAAIAEPDVELEPVAEDVPPDAPAESLSVPGDRPRSGRGGRRGSSR